MKKTIIFITLLLAFCKISNAQWETLYWISNSPQLPQLFAVNFKDYKSGMIAGYYYINHMSPIIIRTNDSGISWDTVYFTSDYGIFNDIIIIDSNSAIAVGQYYNGGKGIIAKTNDFGNSWDTLIVNKVLIAVDFPDNSTGYAVGNYGAILKTINSGQTWTPLTTLPVSYLNSVQFVNDSTGFTCGDSNIYKTQDGGISWTVTNISNLAYQRSLLNFPSDSVGYFYIPQRLYKTTDCGVHWVNYSSLVNPNGVFYKMFFVNDTIGYAMGPFCVKKTVDGGHTWVDQSSLPPSSGYFFDDLTDVYFVGIDTGFVVGLRQLYRTFHGGDLIISSVPSIHTNDNVSLSVYPNPFFNTATISFDYQENEKYTLIIYNASGQKIIEKTDITTGKIIVDRSLMKSGLYFFQLQNSNGILGTGKLILE